MFDMVEKGRQFRMTGLITEILWFKSNLESAANS